MYSEAKEDVVLILKYISEDDFSMPVYRDQYDRLWKDINLGETEQPELCSVMGNEMDGDPNTPIKQEFIIQPMKGFVSKEKRFQYQMLDRLRTDCDYYLGYGNRYAGCLWAKSEKKQIAEMKAIWNSFSEDEKPEWLTWEKIEKYEEEMVN